MYRTSRDSGADPGEWQADDLILVRESSTGLSQLEGMAAQAHANARTVRGVAELERIGVRALREPEAFDGELFTGPKRRLVVFPAPETGQATWQILAVASATETDEDGQWFTEVFSSVLQELRPRNLWLPSAGRLARDLLAGHQALRCIEENVGTVYLGSCPVEIGPHNPAGMMQLTFAIAFATTERDELVRRNLQGKVSAVGQRDRFLGGPSAVPLGYRLGRYGALEPDPEAGPVLELACRLLADPTGTPADTAAAMGRARLRPPSHGGDGSWSWDARAVDADLARLRAVSPDLDTAVPAAGR